MTNKDATKLNPTTIAITATFTALTFVATYFLQISLPISGGYFNLGEVVIYITALAFGPWIGAFAGGIGSMLADIASPYAVWAPGTLVIKGLEGLVVGLLYARLKRGKSSLEPAKPKDIVSLLIFGFLSSASIIIFGVAFFADGLVVWIILAILMLVAIMLAVYYIKVNMYWITFSVLAGMLIMVPGYLIYGFFLKGAEALTEVPVNIIQCLVGMYLAIPVYQSLYKSKILENFVIQKKAQETAS
nr:ECF transporter S component [Candidatus Sigynarchaeota archaeon]